MMYLDTKQRVLKKELGGDEVFTVADAERALELKRSSIYWILYNLTQRGQLERIGKGYYRFPLSSPVSTRAGTYLSATAQIVLDRLEKEGLNFFITGLDILTSYFDQLPSSYPPIVYVEKGSSDWATRVLQNLDQPVLVDPRSEDIELARRVRPSVEPIIVRETADLAFGQGHLATREKAFLDIYFEVTRGYYPFPLGDVAHVLVNFSFHGDLNIVRLLNAGRRRRIEKEIRYILIHGLSLLHETSHIQVSAAVGRFAKMVRELRNEVVHGKHF
jgi:hypothetical protein